LLATITDGNEPLGLDVDSTGTLYVSELGYQTINVYAPGATTATTVLSDTGPYPIGVAHCLDGTTYVANEGGNPNGYIAYYVAPATVPTGTIPDTNINAVVGVACDANSNVYADYIDGNGKVQIVKYGPQGSSSSNTGYGASMSSIGQIRVTHNGLLAVADGAGSISFFRLASPGVAPFLTSTWNATFFGFSIGLAGNDAFVADNPDSDASALRFGKREHRRHGSPLNGGSPQADTVFRASARNLRMTEDYGAGVLNQPFDAFVYPGGNR